MYDPTVPDWRERRRVRRLAFLLVGMFVGVAFTPGLPTDADFAAPLEIPTTTFYNPYRNLLPGNPTTTVWSPDPIAPDLDADQHNTESITAAVPAVPDGLTYQPPTTTTTLVPDSALCGEWWVTATAVGWDVADLPTLDRIMWNESRCQPDVISSTKDYGLAQINRKVWRDDVEAMGWTMDDLLNPAVNLLVAKHVADSAEAIGWCRFQPWHGFSGDYC